MLSTASSPLCREERKMKVSTSLAEPSLANTLDPSQQLCKSKHAQRLCSDICHRTELFTTFDTK